MQNIPLLSFSEKNLFPVSEGKLASLQYIVDFESFLDKEMMEAKGESPSDSATWKKILEEIFFSLENVFSFSTASSSISLEKVGNQTPVSENADCLKNISTQEAITPSLPNLYEGNFFQEIGSGTAVENRELYKQDAAIGEKDKQIPNQRLFLEENALQSQSETINSLALSFIPAKESREFQEFPGEITKDKAGIKIPLAQENKQNKSFDTLNTIDTHPLVFDKKTEYIEKVESPETFFPPSDFSPESQKVSEENPEPFVFGIEKKILPAEVKETVLPSQKSGDTPIKIEYKKEPVTFFPNPKIQKAILYLEKEEKKMQVHLKLEGDSLDAQFLTTDAKTVSMLEVQIQDLRDSLYKNGIHLAESKIVLTDGNSFSREKSQRENAGRQAFFSRGKKIQEIESSRQGYSVYQWVSYAGKNKINCYT